MTWQDLLNEASNPRYHLWTQLGTRELHYLVSGHGGDAFQNAYLRLLEMAPRTDAERTTKEVSDPQAFVRMAAERSRNKKSRDDKHQECHIISLPAPTSVDTDEAEEDTSGVARAEYAQHQAWQKGFVTFACRTAHQTQCLKFLAVLYHLGSRKIPPTNPVFPWVKDMAEALCLRFPQKDIEKLFESPHCQQNWAKFAKRKGHFLVPRRPPMSLSYAVRRYSTAVLEEWDDEK